MRRSCLVIVVLLGSAVSLLASPASLRQTIQQARAKNRSLLEIDTNYDIPWQRTEKAVSTAVLASGDPDAVVEKVAKSLSITRAAAAPLIEARLRLAVYGEPDKNIVEELLRQALREAPRSRDVVAFYVANHHEQSSDDEFAKANLPIVRVLPPVDAEIVGGALFGARAAIVFADGLRRDPHNPRLFRALTEEYDPALNATFGPIRFTDGKPALRESWKPLNAKKIATAGSVQIQALAGAGRAADVLALFDALPRSARDAIMSNRLDDDGPEIDVRLDLGAAAILTGDADRARTFIAGGSRTNNRRLLQALLAPAIDDVYDVLADTINSDARPSGGIWSIAFADLATRGGYDAAGAAILRNANRWDSNEVAIAALGYLPDSLRTELQTTMDRNAASIAALHARVTSVPASEAILKRLGEPSRVLFAEKALPAAIGASDATPIDCSDTERVAQTIHIPAGWCPIRLERKGEEVAGIAVSPALDPSGEVGRGAYWVLHSSDGGQSWDEPLYTGLRENAPYLVLPASSLPLMNGDHLDVAVDIHEIDPASITFPPMGLRTKREAHGLYLQLPWAELRRDSDGDGITDLVEERIATDPHSADSDGDGIVDGNDGLPLVALGSGTTPASEVLATLLRGFHTGGGAIIVGLPSNVEERNACVARASAMSGGALFLVGDRSLFTPIDVNRRVVVLTRDEMAAYEKKFGPTYAADVSLMIVRHDGKRALVVLNESWKEDVYELTKTKDGWIATIVGGWIS